MSSRDPLWIAARFTGADAALLRPEDKPHIPDWFPLPSEDEPLSPEQRNRARVARATLEACQGPHDGRREQVRRQGDGTPYPSISLYDGTAVYVLDDRATTKEQAVYRYSPQLSHMHQGCMRAVEAAFNEYGVGYAQEATHDDSTAPGRTAR
jgi:hypothetical protein